MGIRDPPRLLVAAGNSLLAAFTAFPIALVLGLAIAIAQRTRFRSVKQFIRECVDFIRTTPLLLQIYFVFYVGPDSAWSLPDGWPASRVSAFTIVPTFRRFTGRGSTGCRVVNGKPARPEYE